MKRFIVFLFASFAPVFVFFALFLFGVIVNMLINISYGLGLAFFFLLLLSIFLLLGFSCYRLCVINTSWVKRGIILYIFWIIISLVLGAVLLYAIGATSMAYVEGGVTRQSLNQQVLGQIFPTVFLGNIIIIPWLVISIIIMRKKEKVFFATSGS